MQDTGRTNSLIPWTKHLLEVRWRALWPSAFRASGSEDGEPATGRGGTGSGGGAGGALVGSEATGTRSRAVVGSSSGEGGGGGAVAPSALVGGLVGGLGLGDALIVLALVLVPPSLERELAAAGGSQRLTCVAWL